MPEDKYLSLSSRERFELLDHASQERGLAPSILEKDYWVCKALDVLFSLPDLGEHLVLPGGRVGGGLAALNPGWNAKNNSTARWTSTASFVHFMWKSPLLPPTRLPLKLEQELS